MSITLSRPTSGSEARVTAIHAALVDAGESVEPDLMQLRESAGASPDLVYSVWIVVTGAGLYVGKKVADPSLEAVGQFLRDRAIGVVRTVKSALRGKERADFWVEIPGSDGEIAAIYWLPTGEELLQALDTLVNDWARRRGGEKNRRWYKGYGWVDDREMYERIHHRPWPGA
jgi:hypothetical protein